MDEKRGFMAGVLLDASFAADVAGVEELVAKCETITEIDDEKDLGLTVLMVAARGNGKGGPEFHAILTAIWSSYNRVAGKTLLHGVLLKIDKKNTSGMY